MLKSALPLSKHLGDGRVRDILTGKIDYNNESSVYSILNPNNEELIVKSLKEAADIVGVNDSTLSKRLDIESTDFIVEVNHHFIKRIGVFYKSKETDLK